MTRTIRATAVAAAAALVAAIATVHARHGRLHRTGDLAELVHREIPRLEVAVFDVRGEPRLSIFLSSSPDRGEFDVLGYAQVDGDGRIDATWFDAGRRTTSRDDSAERFVADVRAHLATRKDGRGNTSSPS